MMMLEEISRVCENVMVEMSPFNQVVESRKGKTVDSCDTQHIPFERMCHRRTGHSTNNQQQPQYCISTRIIFGRWRDLRGSISPLVFYLMQSGI